MYFAKIATFVAFFISTFVATGANEITVKNNGRLPSDEQQMEEPRGLRKRSEFHRKLFNKMVAQDSLTIESDTAPFLRLNQNGNIWFPYWWDLAATDATFLIRRQGGAVPFEIESEAPTASFHINDNGDIGINVQYPRHNNRAKLHVNGNVLVEGDLESTTTEEMKEQIRALEARIAILEGFLVR